MLASIAHPHFSQTTTTAIPATSKMTEKSQTPGVEAEVEQLRAKIDAMAEEMVETKAAHDKLHDTVEAMVKRLDDQARAN